MNNALSFSRSRAARCLIVVLGLLWLVPGFTGVVSAQAGGKDPGPRHSHRSHHEGARHHRHEREYDRHLDRWGPDIGVSIAPETEHWRSNYRPDSYQLKGYDGSRGAHHVCRGKHTMTLSTNAGACPPAEHAPRAGRSLSTD